MGKKDNSDLELLQEEDTVRGGQSVMESPNVTTSTNVLPEFTPILESGVPDL